MKLPRRAAIFALLAILASGALGAGCGQKGPLYLPGASPERVEPGVPAGRSPVEDRDADKDTEAEAEAAGEAGAEPAEQR